MHSHTTNIVMRLTLICCFSNEDGKILSVIKLYIYKWMFTTQCNNRCQSIKITWLYSKYFVLSLMSFIFIYLDSQKYYYIIQIMQRSVSLVNKLIDTFFNDIDMKMFYDHWYNDVLFSFHHFHKTSRISILARILTQHVMI